MDLVELPTEAEEEYFLAQCQKHISQILGTNYIVGASYVGVGQNKFYWMTTGEPIDYKLKFVPGQPDNFKGIEKFLSITKGREAYKFNDIDEHGKHHFICQRITNNSNDSYDAEIESYPHIYDRK